VAKSRRKTYKKRKVEVDLGELQGIVNAAAERVITADEHKKLMDSHQLLADLITPDLQSETSDAIKGGETGAKHKGKTDPKERKAPKKNGGRRPRSDFKAAETIRQSHTDLQVGQHCPCGCGGRLYVWKNRFSHFRHFVGQAPIKVTLYERELLKSNGCDSTYPAPLPNGVGPESYDATAISTIAMNRYGVGLPFYRQAKQLDIMGTPISPSTQYMLVSGALPKIGPVYDHLLKLAAQGKVAYFDDTSMRILDFVRPKGDERTGIFTTGIVSVHEAFEIALLFTGRDHAGENRVKLIKEREPDLSAMIMMSDALAANFVGLDNEKEILANCLVHGRRNFVKIIDSFPKDCHHVLSGIGSVYHHDELSKKAGHNDDERLAYHQEHSGPVMTDLKAWLDAQIVEKKVEPNSALGKAIAYMRSHWTGLTLFLRLAGAPLDSNTVERALKNVVLHRKNSLFYRTASGAKTGDTYMALIQTCQRNDINPWDYLTELQRNHLAVEVSPADWLPWKYQETLELLRKQSSFQANPPPKTSDEKAPISAA
jgi:transposase